MKIQVSDKAKGLWGAFIAYGLLILILLPTSLVVQGSKTHEASLFVLVTVLFSLPVVFGVVTLGCHVFSYIRDMITFNHFAGVFFGAAGVSVVLSGLANMAGFIVAGKISSDTAGLFLYPTLLASAIATLVYMGFEKWS